MSDRTLQLVIVSSPLQWSIVTKNGWFITKKLWYFPTVVFLDFWQKLRGRKSKTPSRAGFPRKNPDHSIIIKKCHFRHIIEFWRKMTHESDIERLFFGKLGPFLNSLRKPHVRQNCGSGNNEPGATQIDAIFAFFGHIEWSISGKVHLWPEWYFIFRKTYMRTTYPVKVSQSASAVHEICPPRFFWILNDPKKKFRTKFFFDSESLNPCLKHVFMIFDFFS